MKIKSYSFCRWSSARQSWGDSERRQEQAAIDYCKRNNLELVESKVVKGVSAWKGKQRKYINELVALIKPSEYLLIESTSRFSRENPLAALSLLKDITDKGVKVVFIDQNKTITKDNFFEIGTILPNFIYATIAYGQNEDLSNKLKAVWVGRNEKVKQGLPIRRSLPPWVDYAEGGYILKPAESAVVRQIFKIYNAGKGIYAISKVLNTKDTKAISKRQTCNNYSPLYISRLLHNYQTIGYYDRYGKGKADYWPKVIKEAVFYSVQKRFSISKSIGKSSPEDDNLLSGLIRCAKCNGTMFRHHNTKRITLRCSNASKGLCSYAGVDYNLMKKELSRRLILSAQSQTKLSGVVEQPSKVEELQGMLVDTERRIVKLVDIISEPDSPKSLVVKLKELELYKSSLQDNIETERIQTTANVISNDDIVFLSQHINDKSKKDQIRTLLQQAIDHIAIDTTTKHYTIHFKDNRPTLQGTIENDDIND